MDEVTEIILLYIRNKFIHVLRITTFFNTMTNWMFGLLIYLVCVFLYRDLLHELSPMLLPTIIDEFSDSTVTNSE